MRRNGLLLTGLLAAATALLFSGCMESNLIDSLANGWSLGICGTIIVVLDILAILEIVGSNKTFGSKAAWTLVIIFFPFFGLLFYWFFGK